MCPCNNSSFCFCARFTTRQPRTRCPLVLRFTGFWLCVQSPFLAHTYSVKSRNNTTLSLRKAHTEGNDSHSLKPWHNCSSAEKTKAQSKERPGYESEQERGPRVETCCQATVPYRPAKLGSLGFCFYFPSLLLFVKKMWSTQDKIGERNLTVPGLPFPRILFSVSAGVFPPYSIQVTRTFQPLPNPFPNSKPIPTSQPKRTGKSNTTGALSLHK